MPLTLQQASAVADSLLAELRQRQPANDEATRYYRGDHPLRFASSEFRDYYSKRYQKFSDNWCGVVTDAPVERLTTIGVQPYGEQKADAESWRVWQTNGLELDSQLGYVGAANSARCNVLVWGNPADESTPKVTFEDASQSIVAYEPGSRRDRAAALKHWTDGSLEYVTLYLPDEIWKFERSLYRAARNLNLIGVADALREWKPREVGHEPNPLPNPLGVVPMVELANRPLLADDPISDITGVMAMQDSINFIWALLFNAADFASFPQRIVLGAEMPTTPILNADGQIIGERPIPLEKFAVDRVLWVPDENASVANWPAADLTAYTEVLEVQVGHIAAQTRTPSHYLIGSMVNVTGDALLAAEVGLVKKTEEKQLWFGAGEREVFRLIALAQGDTGKARALAAGTVLWADAESRNQAQLADSLVKLKTVGFPFEYLAAKYGLTPPEITTLMEMREREAAQDPISQIMNPKPDLIPAGP